MITKFLLPVFGVVSLIALVLTGGKAAPHLLVGFANVLMTSTLFAYLFLRKFPFSMPVQTNARAGNIILSIAVTLLPFGVGVLHAFTRDSWVGLTIMGLVSASATFLLLQQMQKREWQSILSVYSEE